MNHQFSPSLWHQAPAGQCGPAIIAASTNGQVLRSRFGWVTDPRSMASISPPASVRVSYWRPIKKPIMPKVVDAASAVDLFRKSDSKNFGAFDRGWDIDLVHIELCKNSSEERPSPNEYKPRHYCITAIRTAVRSDGPFLNEMNPTIRREERGVPSCPFRHILPPLTPNPQNTGNSIEFPTTKITQIHLFGSQGWSFRPQGPSRGIHGAKLRHPTMASHDKMRLLEFGQQEFAQNTALSPDCIGKGQTAEFFTEKCWYAPVKAVPNNRRTPQVAAFFEDASDPPKKTRKTIQRRWVAKLRSLKPCDDASRGKP